MGTASTSTVVDHTSDASFRTWVAEIIAQLGVVGLSQTGDTGQINTGSVTRPAANTIAGYSIWRYTDTLAKGPAGLIGSIVGGSAYTAGTYTAVPMTGGTGSGALATVVVAGGVVTTVTITTAGTNYLVGDSLSAAAANIGGTGSGFTAYLKSTTTGSPVVIKLEFGTGSGANNVQMLITIGTRCDGAGTLSGTTNTQVAICSGQGALSNITSYTSRFVYNTTYGFLAMVWKIGGFSNTYTSLGGFVIFRSNDSTGAATGETITINTNSYNTTGIGSGGGYVQSTNYANATTLPTTPTSNANLWLASSGTTPMPFNVTTTTSGGNSYLVPVYYLQPIITMSAYNCVGLMSEAALGSTFTTALIGVTTLTFLQVGCMFGNSYLSAVNIGVATGAGYCILWQ